MLAGNMLIDATEVAVAVVALPSMRADLHLSLASAQWLVTGFAAGFGGLMLFGTRLVHRYGRRRVYLTAIVAFAVVSLLGSLARDPGLLLTARLVKGFCVALTAPTGLAIITSAGPGGRVRDRAISVYTLFGAVGFSAGLVLSGFLTVASWRWTFVLPGLAMLALLPGALRLIPPDPPRTPAAEGRARNGGAGSPRTLEALCFTGALVALVHGVTGVPAHGWLAVRSVTSLTPAVLLLAFVAWRGAGTPDKLLKVSRFGNRDLRGAAFCAASLNGSYLGLLLVATLQLQEEQGWSPLTSALALLPASLPLALSAPFAGRLVRRFAPARLIAVGLFFPVLGYGWYLWRHEPFSYATGLLPTLLLVAAGFVLSFTALNVEATAGAPAEDKAEISGTYQTAVQLGAVFVPAVVAALLSDASGGVTVGRPALAVVCAVGAAGFLLGLSGLRRAHRAGDRHVTGAP
ncbi:MFS transporter [Streptomyces sp. NPDC055189]